MQCWEESGKYLLQGHLYLRCGLVQTNPDIAIRCNRTASAQDNRTIAALLPIFSGRGDGSRHPRCKYWDGRRVGECLPSYWRDQVGKLREQFTGPGVDCDNDRLSLERAAHGMNDDPPTVWNKLQDRCSTGSYTGALGGLYESLHESKRVDDSFLRHESAPNNVPSKRCLDQLLNLRPVEQRGSNAIGLEGRHLLCQFGQVSRVKREAEAARFVVVAGDVLLFQDTAYECLILARQVQNGVRGLVSRPPHGSRVGFGRTNGHEPAIAPSRFMCKPGTLEDDRSDSYSC